jgi:hypothetical protein
VGKPEGKRPIGKSTLKWMLETKNGMVWTGLIWLRIGIDGELSLVNTVLHLQVP